MLRSFDYAANHLRPAAPLTADQEAASEAWAGKNRAAFLAGYTAAATLPWGDAAVIAAFELDKAVYEVAYEHTNRPDWEPIPLHAVDRLTAAGAAASSAGTGSTDRAGATSADRAQDDIEAEGEKSPQPTPEESS